MIPYDIKNYRANQPGLLRRFAPQIFAVIALVALLSYLDKRDRAAHVEQVRQAAAAQCTRL